MFHSATGIIGNAGKQLHSTTRTVGNTLQTTTDRMLPPQQRKEIIQNLRVFAQENPKLASFLAAQACIAGLPLVLFFAFATTTLLVSLSTCLLLGLLAALAFTFFIIGFALLFVVPTVFIASCSATFIFVWGVLGYAILRRLNGGEAPDKHDSRIADKLRGLKGGRPSDSTGGENNDSKSVTSYKTSINTPIKKNGMAMNSTEAHHDTLNKVNGNPTNKINETNELNDNDPTEWKHKWVSGEQPEPMVDAVAYPYEVPKAETVLS